jgi:stalled ribosome rescue protein Dom34
MSSRHAIVWIDSREAHVFRFTAEEVNMQRVKAHLPVRKIHHKAGVVGSGHVHLDHAYFHEIAQALDGAHEWLLTGPGVAKDEMLVYLHGSEHGLQKKFVGVETVDHPTDGQLVDHARRFFKAVDRMRPNSPSPIRG